MSSAETTELKLKTTPTGGIDASRSPYYRRLLSAGYKGYLQGTIGGASLYGAIGAVIGGLIALPLLFNPVIGFAALAFIPAVAGVGLFKGASTFGTIGSTAAINAESNDLSEQRRYLLDRYHDLPEGPEGDREAAEIRRELIRRQEINPTPPPLFHWKTVAICAAVGAAIALTLCTPVGAAIFGGVTPMAHVLAALGLHGEAAAAIAAMSTGIGTALGALTGAVVGLDRYYIRKWFDVTEGVVHSTPSPDLNSELKDRSDLLSRLREAAKQDDVVKQNIIQHQQAAHTSMVAAMSAPQLSAAESAKPDTKISEATRQDRLTQLQRAMDVSL